MIADHKNRSLEEFPLKDQERKGHYLERGIGVKSFFCFLKKEAIMLYFHGVGTNPVQRQKIEFHLLRREGHIWRSSVS